MSGILAMTGTDGLLEAVYVLCGLALFVFAGLTLMDRRHPHPRGSACFWTILGITFVFGNVLPHVVSGVLVLMMVGLDGLGWVKPSAAVEKQGELAAADASLASPGGSGSGVTAVLEYSAVKVQEESPLKNRIFIPVLAIPIVTIVFALLFRVFGLDVNKGALIGLGLGGVGGMLVAQRLTRARFGEMMDAGRRLNECMGAVNILPQLLASLGVLFTAAGVGALIAKGVVAVVPRDHLFLLIVANCLGMSLFTMVMGNSFAAFPVITAGVLVPLIVKPFGVDPAMAAIITLTAGSSGTLITPMAANFNIVPAALLEMRRTDGVLKFQLPFALVIWPMHVVVMWGLIKVMG